MSTPVPWADSPRPPREWQRLALPAIGEALRKGERPIVRAATGTGKAQLIAEICALLSRPGEVVVVVAPRQSLVEQLSGVGDDYDGPGLRPGSVAWRLGLDRVGVYYGGRKVLDGPGGSVRPVVVACGPSLGALADVLRLRGVTCRALVCDEAHRSESAAILEAVSRLAPRYVIGFSATPWRSEAGESLSLFSREVVRYGIGQAIRDRVLVPWETLGWDVAGRGDPGADVACAHMIRELPPGSGPGIVSARNIPDAEKYAALLSADGLPALAIHSEMSKTERRSRVARLLSGDLRCLVHVALLTEGTDIPELRWICMRRPSATAIRFVQELGRVLRTAPGKTHALLLDPYDHEGSIGVEHESRVGSADALDAAMEREAGHRGAREVSDEEPPMPPLVAVSEVTRWARRAMLALVEAGLAEAPLRGGRWRSALPSDKQLDALRKIGGTEARAVLTHAELLCRGEVSDLIGFLSALRKAQRERRAIPPLPEVSAAAVASLARRAPPARAAVGAP